MTATGPLPRTRNAGEHLELLRALAAEVQRAMNAIAANDIEQLEVSIANQQDLSSRLTSLANQIAHPLPQNPALAESSAAPHLTRQIRTAAAELNALNLRYSYLLKYSSRSVAQMASLFSSFKGQIKEDSGARSKVQTWSCQV